MISAAARERLALGSTPSRAAVSCSRLVDSVGLARARAKGSIPYWSFLEDDRRTLNDLIVRLWNIMHAHSQNDPRPK